MKKIGKFLICLCLTCSFMLTGCSLVQKNTLRYLDRTVASVGNEITVTKRELLSSYNSYGYQYVSNYGYTTEKAIKTVLDNLIDRKIILEKAKKVIKEQDVSANQDGSMLEMHYVDGDIDEKIYNANVWQNKIWQEVFDGVNDQIASIEDSVRSELNISEPEEKKDDSKNEFDAESVYTKKVKYEGGKWSVIKSELDAPEESQLKIGDFVQKNTGDSNVSSIAFKRYIKSLVNGYQDYDLTISDTTVSQSDFDSIYSKLNLSTKEKIAFLYELNRIYDVYDENQYVTEFQTVYENYKQSVDDNLNQKIVDYYKSLVNASHDKYAQLDGSGIDKVSNFGKYKYSESDGYKQYVTDMQDDSSIVYYHPAAYGKFVAVSHVLIKLSDDQTSEIKDLQTKRDTGVIDQQEYDYEYNKILNSTVVHARDEDGKETDVTKTVAEVYDEINADLSRYTTTEEKAVAFNKYIYKYGQDTGMINATHYYVVNMDTDVTDKMVAPFANKARELANEEEDGGNLSEPVFVSQDNYTGYHIIFNAGIVKDNLNIDQVNSLTYKDADYLYNQKLMLGTDKTVYDSLYDTVYSSNYSEYQNSLTKTAKDNLKVTYYVSAYKDLY